MSGQTSRILYFLATDAGRHLSTVLDSILAVLASR
jgi:hypothetical protein